MSNEIASDAPDATAVATTSAEVKAVVEALIFASPEPITPKMLYKLLAEEPKEDVMAAVNALKADYENRPGPADGGSRGRLSDRHASPISTNGSVACSTSARRRS
jgi:hypothetical protein